MIRADRSAIQCRVLHSPSIIPHPAAFVKGFLKSFFNFFSSLFSSRSGSARTVYHILSRLSRGFSKVFSTFFAVSFGLSLCSSLLRDSLHIIALLLPFVNRFLQSFFTLEKVAGLHKFGHGFCAPCPISVSFCPRSGCERGL